MPVAPERTPLAGRRAARATALVVIDMFSAWDFPDADALGRAAIRAAGCIAALKKRCDRAGVPTVFVNDNRGRWRSDAPGIVAESAVASRTGAAIARTPASGRAGLLRPQAQTFGIFCDAARPAAAPLAGPAAHRLGRRRRSVRAPRGDRGAHAGLRRGGAGRLRRRADRGAQCVGAAPSRVGAQGQGRRQSRPAPRREVSAALARRVARQPTLPSSGESADARGDEPD